MLSEGITRDILKKCIGIGTRKIPKCEEFEILFTPLLVSMNRGHVDHALIYDFKEFLSIQTDITVLHRHAIARYVKHMTN